VEKVNIWTKLETVTQIGILVFAITAVYFSVIASNTANEIAQTNLKLSNYNMTIIAYICEANLGMFNYTGNATNALSAYGNLSLSLIVITPHAAILNISNPQKATTFTRVNNTYPTGHGTYLPLLDPDEYYNSMLLVGSLAVENLSFSFPSAHPPFFQEYEGFVQSGVTQVNFTVPLYGLFFLNRQFFRESGQAVPFGMLATLASFNINMTVTDAVTRESFVKDYSGDLDVWIWANPPF
jgi:hypothetical protein